MKHNVSKKNKAIQFKHENTHLTQQLP